MPPAKKSATRRIQRSSSGNIAAADVKSGRSLVMMDVSPQRSLASFGGFQKLPSDMPPPPFTKLKPSNGSSSKGKDREVESNQSVDKVHLWADYMTPKSKADIAVHKKKIQQVEGWLNEALDKKNHLRKYRRILLLSGPAGCGKSTLIRMLANKQELDYELIEWKNETRQFADGTKAWDHGRRAQFDDFDSIPSTNQHRFTQFLMTASRFSTLTLEGNNGDQKEVDKSFQTKRRILFVDELPNLQYEPARLAFQESLRLILSTPVTQDSAPLVISLSESSPRTEDWEGNFSMNNWKDRLDDTINIRRIIPETVRQHPAVNHIAFNPIAVTYMRKSLQNILTIQRQNGNLNLPIPTSVKGKEFIEAVVATSNGDIRSAINALQLTCMGLNNKFESIKRMANGEKKISNSNLKLSTTGREASLALFHAVNRILYNKRKGDPKREKDESSSEEENISLEQHKNTFPPWTLPPHLLHLERRKSKINVESLWRNMPIDASTMQIYLHQNYTPFCGDIDQCANLMENLSLATTIGGSLQEEWLHSGLTQHYAFLLSTYGTLLSLPSPTPRGKELRLSGAKFFDVIKKTRKTYEMIEEFSTNWQSGSAIINQDDQNNSISSLAQTSKQEQICQTLPLLIKCGQTLPNEIQSCIEFQIKTDFQQDTNTMTTINYNKFGFNNNEEDEEEANLSAMEEEEREKAPPTPVEAIQSRIKTLNSSISANSALKTSSQTAKDIVDVMDVEEEIEDFDN